MARARVTIEALNAAKVTERSKNHATKVSTDPASTEHATRTKALGVDTMSGAKLFTRKRHGLSTGALSVFGASVGGALSS